MRETIDWFDIRFVRKLVVDKMVVGMRNQNTNNDEFGDE